MKSISMDDVKASHHGKWFHPNTMSFWGCRLGNDAIETDDGNRRYFVTSEKSRSQGSRRYTVRVQLVMIGDIDTVGSFQQYKSRQEANRAMMREALRYESQRDI